MLIAPHQPCYIVKSRNCYMWNFTPFLLKVCISIQSTFNYALISILHNSVVSIVCVRSSKVKIYKHITLCISNGKTLQFKGYTLSLPHAK